jgi:hypothetical protein
MFVRQLSGYTANVSSNSWRFDATPTFDNGYNSKDVENQGRVDEALEVLAESRFPNRLGTIKNIPDGRVCVYKISKSSRLSYNVSFATKTIQLIRVCDHKTVYGKD